LFSASFSVGKHLKQLKAKKAQGERWVDPHEAELKQKLKQQSVKFKVHP
jgi:hypothetical protein